MIVEGAYLREETLALSRYMSASARSIAFVPGSPGFRKATPIAALILTLCLDPPASIE
jgi:hypothetical protein